MKPALTGCAQLSSVLRGTSSTSVFYKMKPVLYGHIYSPPTRSILMLIKELNLDVDYKHVEVFDKEQFSADFIKVNPMHTVPTLTHGDLTLTDSQSIIMYMVDAFAKDSSLFPTELIKRARIINKLMFNGTQLFPRWYHNLCTIVNLDQKDYQKNYPPIEEALNALNTFLTQDKFVAGPELSIADFSILATVSTIDILWPITEEKFPKVYQWFTELKKLPYYEEENQKGLEVMRKLIFTALEK